MENNNNKDKNDKISSHLGYNINLKELIERPIIRDDQPEEVFNKMTDEELIQWERDVEKILLKEGVDKKFPEWNSSFFAKHVDITILYNLLKMGDKNEE